MSINSLASAEYARLKSGLFNSKVINLEEYESFIKGLVFSGVNSPNIVFSNYCSCAYVMGIEFLPIELDEVACVNVSDLDGNFHLNVNPVRIIEVTQSDYEVLFVIAHEISHLLHGHLIKYRENMSDYSISVITNLCLDVEVNERISKELNVDRENQQGVKTTTMKDFNWGNSLPSKKSRYIPKSAYTMKSFCDLVKLNEYTILKKIGKMDTLADACYKMVNYRFKKWLGVSIQRASLNIKLDGTIGLNNAIHMVARGNVHCPIFSIPSGEEENAIEFCKKLAMYIKNTITAIICVSGSNGSTTKGTPGGESKGGGVAGENESFNNNGKKTGSGGGESQSKNKESTKKADGEGSNSESENMKTGSGVKDSSGNVVVVGATADSIKELMDTLMDTVEKVSNNMQGLIGGVGRSESGGGVKGSTTIEDVRTQIKWQDLLKRFMTAMSRELVATKKRINRRQPQRLELSGRKVNPVVQLVVAFDESGSIGNKEYSYFVKELASLIKTFNCEVFIYRFTSRVEEYIHAKDSREANKFLKSKIYTSRHSGGTCYQPVFDAIDANKRIHKNDCIIVFLTDGYAEAEVDFKGTKKRIWVLSTVNGTNTLSCEDLYGKIYPVVI